MILVSMLTSVTLNAANPVKVEESVKQMAVEFENKEGMDCMVIEKGEGLGLIKAMFKQHFGRKFMKGVTSMVMIDYTNATNEVRDLFKSKVAAVANTLKEFDLGEMDLEEGEYVKSYASSHGENSVTDFMIMMEDKESMMFLYMGGELIIDQLDFNL